MVSDDPLKQLEGKKFCSGHERTHRPMHLAKSAFRKRSDAHDGLQTRCKDCMKALKQDAAIKKKEKEVNKSHDKSVSDAMRATVEAVGREDSETACELLDALINKAGGVEMFAGRIWEDYTNNFGPAQRASLSQHILKAIERRMEREEDERTPLELMDDEDLYRELDNAIRRCGKTVENPYGQGPPQAESTGAEEVGAEQVS